MAINLSIPELIEGLIKTQIFFTEEEQHVVKKEYLNDGAHTGNQIAQSDYDRLLVQSKTKIKDHLRIDVDNPPKYLVHALLRRCPIYLIPGIIRQPKFEDLFSRSHTLLKIACMRLEYLVEADPEEDLLNTLIVNDLDFDRELFKTCEDAIEALIWFLVNTDNPPFIDEKVLVCCIHAFEKDSPLTQGVFLEMVRKSSISLEALYWGELFLRDILDKMDENEEEYMEGYNPDKERADDPHYDDIIECLISNPKVSVRTLEWLLRKVMQQEKYELAVRILKPEKFNSRNIDLRLDEKEYAWKFMHALIQHLETVDSGKFVSAITCITIYTPPCVSDETWEQVAYEYLSVYLEEPPWSYKDIPQIDEKEVAWKYIHSLVQYYWQSVSWEELFPSITHITNYTPPGVSYETWKHVVSQYIGLYFERPPIQRILDRFSEVELRQFLVGSEGENLQSFCPPDLSAKEWIYQVVKYYHERFLQ